MSVNAVPAFCGVIGSVGFFLFGPDVYPAVECGDEFVSVVVSSEDVDVVPWFERGSEGVCSCGGGDGLFDISYELWVCLVVGVAGVVDDEVDEVACIEAGTVEDAAGEPGTNASVVEFTVEVTWRGAVKADDTYWSSISEVEEVGCAEDVDAFAFHRWVDVFEAAGLLCGEVTPCGRVIDAVEGRHGLVDGGVRLFGLLDSVGLRSGCGAVVDAFAFAVREPGEVLVCVDGWVRGGVQQFECFLAVFDLFGEGFGEVRFGVVGGCHRYCVLAGCAWSSRCE